MAVPSIAAFRNSLGNTAPAPDLSPALEALWWAHRGNWKAAHRIVQADNGDDAAWVHAYLHRQEGDLINAGYWYKRAGRTAANGGSEAEWDTIVTALSAGE